MRLSSERTVEHERGAVGDAPLEPKDLNGSGLRREFARADDVVPALSPRLLFVVAEHQLGLYRHLARSFQDNDEVEVILDRRMGDRRHVSAPASLERRRGERRSGVDAALLQSRGWLVAWSQTAPRVHDDAGIGLLAAAARVMPEAAPRVAPAPPFEPMSAPDVVPVGLGHETPASPAPSASAEPVDDWGTLTGEDVRGLELIRAKLAREFPEIEADDDARDPPPAGRDRRPVMAMVVGGVLAAAALGYAAVAGVASWARSTRSETPAPDNGPPRAAQEMSGVSSVRASSQRELPAPSLPARPAASPASPAGDGLAARTAAEAEVVAAFRAWVETINRRQIATHIAWYADPVLVFYNARNVPRSVVRTLRARTFNDATRMDVRTSDPEVRLGADGRDATMVFRKGYVFEGPRINRRGNVVQELRWQKAEDGWRIVGERTFEGGQASKPKVPPRG